MPTYAFLLPTGLQLLLSLHRNDGHQVFGNIAFDPDTEVNRHNNFRTFTDSLILLFR